MTEPRPAPDGPSDEAPDRRPHGHHDECYACPVGGLFLTARGANPEAMDHLVNAATELVAAAKVVLEAAEGYLAQQRGPRRPGPGEPDGAETGARSAAAHEKRVKRIDLDG